MFYNFNQNNSGGYFVENDKYGVCEYVIIEAKTADEAWNKLEAIGDNVSGMFAYCGCCGERWSPPWKDEGSESPQIYGTPIEQCERELFRNRAFVHYANGTIKEFVFPEKVALSTP